MNLRSPQKWGKEPALQSQNGRVRERQVASSVSLQFSINDLSQVGEVRRITQSISREFNFTETETGKLAIVITEVGNNIIKHAGHGEILIRRLAQGLHHGIEVLAIDKGPGMKDPAQSLQDGVSTVGTAG